MLTTKGKWFAGLGANAVALGLVGWLAWDAWERRPWELPEPPASMPVDRAAVSAGPDWDVNQVIRAHLFGQQQRQQQVVQRAAPPTRLNLKLVGVIAAGADQGALALIEVSRGQQQVIRVGQPIGSTGAVLNRVEGDHVLIERNGKLEKLAIERPALDLDNPLPQPDGDGALAAGDGSAPPLPEAPSEQVTVPGMPVNPVTRSRTGMVLPF